jgi:phosphoglycolate phosphatase
MAEALLTADAARSLVDSVDAFLFDCDGLLFIAPSVFVPVPVLLRSH